MVSREIAKVTFFTVRWTRRSRADTEFLKADPVYWGDAPRCPVCGRYLGMRSWLAPRRAQLIVHGEEPGDFAFASSSEFLVSERVKRSVTSRGLSGLEGFEEVEIASIVMRCETTPPPYFHVQPRLCGADVNGQRSVIERTDDILCTHCLTDGLEAIRGFEIDTASWTGADVFVPRGLPGVIVVSDAFRRAVVMDGLSNMDLIQTTEYSWDASALPTNGDAGST